MIFTLKTFGYIFAINSQFITLLQYLCNPEMWTAEQFWVHICVIYCEHFIPISTSSQIPIITIDIGKDCFQLRKFEANCALIPESKKNMQILNVHTYFCLELLNFYLNNCQKYNFKWKYFLLIWRRFSKSLNCDIERSLLENCQFLSWA